MKLTIQDNPKEGNSKTTLVFSVRLLLLLTKLSMAQCVFTLKMADCAIESLVINKAVRRSET